MSIRECGIQQKSVLYSFRFSRFALRRMLDQLCQITGAGFEFLSFLFVVRDIIQRKHVDKCPAALHGPEIGLSYDRPRIADLPGDIDRIVMVADINKVQSRLRMVQDIRLELFIITSGHGDIHVVVPGNEALMPDGSEKRTVNN